MKINNILPVAFMALAALSFTSCDGKDEPDYAPADKPAEAQRVFFATSSMSKTVVADATSFDVNVYRPENEEAEELTVQLLFTDESHLFSIPEAVTFPAGQSFATIPVHYDATAMTPNTPYAVSIAIDEANADEYGESSISITMNYEVMTDWALFGYVEGTEKTGLGVWTLASVFQGNAFDGARVMERHIPSNAKNIEFRLQLWDGDEGTEPDAMLPIDSELWFNAMNFSTTDGGKSITVPLQDFPLASGYRMASAAVLFPDEFEPSASNWNDVTGTFTLNIMYVAGTSAYNPGDETIVLAGFADLNDYTVNITSGGQININDTDYAILAFNYNAKAVAQVDYTVVEVEEGEELTEEQIAKIAETIQDPEQEAYTVQSVTAPGNISLTFPTSGTYAVVAVAYNAKGEAKSTSTCTFAYETFNPYEGWTEIGTAKFNANIPVALAAMLGADLPNEEYEVTVSQNDETPELYRINMPFSAYSHISAFGEPAAFGSIEFVVMDADHVYFPMSETDLSLQGDVFSMMSYSYYMLAQGTAAEEIPADLWGSFKDGKLTLPVAESAEQNILFSLGKDGPYILNTPLTLEMNAEAPAAKPRRNATRLAGNISGMRFSAVPVYGPAFFSARWEAAPRASLKSLSINPDAVRR